MTYQEALERDRYAQAALSVNGLTQPLLGELAWYLRGLDEQRKVVKGREMTLDHLRQLAVKWSR